MSTIPRIALVTGASRGIGRAIALRLAADGFAVAINYAHDDPAAREVAGQITSSGGQAVALRADISNEAQVAGLFQRTSQQLGRPDVIVHNAGTMPLAPIATGHVAEFDRAIATNLRSTFLVMAQAGQVLREGGRFIALSSSVLAKNFPGYGPYIASKAGVEGLVRVFANELRGRGVTANAIAPGPVATELFLRDKTPGQVEAIASQSPMDRIAEPGEVAAAVSFLAGPDGAWVNAQVLRVNGGFA